MLFWIILMWIVLGARPSRKNLYILTGVFALIAMVILAMDLTQRGIPPTPDVIVAYGLGLVPFLIMFLVVGFIVIWLRGGSVEGDAAKGKKLDREMERIRAEIAAREGQPPGAS
jgi:hypothetical protein